MDASTKPIEFDRRYINSLLLDETNIHSRQYAAGCELLRKYSHIPEDHIVAHIADIQRRAYALCPYPCIGLLRFLICSLSEHHIYPTILARLLSGATYLDIGCCFGQDIRRLAYDGVPTERCTGVDIEPGFFAFSNELFRDGDRLTARFLSGDIFRGSDKVWTDMHGRIDIVHATSFFHLFGLPKQRLIARAINRLVRPVPNSVVLGLQIAAAGEAEALPVFSENEPTYCHSPETMQELWDDAGKEASLEEKGLAWNVEMRKKKVPKRMKVGLLVNPKLNEVTWIATIVKKSES